MVYSFIIPYYSRLLKYKVCRNIVHFDKKSITNGVVAKEHHQSFFRSNFRIVLSNLFLRSFVRLGIY